MTKDLADELERLATKLDDEPDAARRIYRTAALSLWVENNLPQILSALRAKPAEGEPVAWRWRAIFDDASRGGWFYETGPLSRDIYTRQGLEHQPLYTRDDLWLQAAAEIISLRADITGLEDGNMTWMCDQLDKAKAENAAQAVELERMREALEMIAEGSAPPDPHGHYLAHRRAVDVARQALSVKAG